MNNSSFLHLENMAWMDKVTLEDEEIANEKAAIAEMDEAFEVLEQQSRDELVDFARAEGVSIGAFIRFIGN